MKLLIMGAGYVGMSLIKKLQNPSYELYLTTTQKDKVAHLTPYAKEVILLLDNEREKLEHLIDICEAMVILVAPKNSQNYEATYLTTAKTISKILEGRKKPFYLLYTSSTSVYEGIEEWAHEEDLLFPRSVNTKILLETEKCYLDAHAQTCILRLGGIYGPGRDLLARAHKLSGKTLEGSGNEPTNHIHLEDIVSGILFCLTHFLTGTYNLVNDAHLSRKLLYDSLCELLKIPSPNWDSRSPKKSYIVSNDKIKRAGFAFSHSTLEE
jgi:nucleoside-diphosphate-sugar epimerase